MLRLDNMVKAQTLLDEQERADVRPKPSLPKILPARNPIRVPPPAFARPARRRALASVRRR